MKAKLRTLLIPIILLGVAVTFSTSCEKAAEKALYDCVDNTPTGICGTFKTCINESGSGYYEFNGVKYNFYNYNYTEAANNMATAVLAYCSKKSPATSIGNDKQEKEQLVLYIKDQTKIIDKSLKLQQ